MDEANRQILSSIDDSSTQHDFTAPSSWWPPADRTTAGDEAAVDLQANVESYHSARKSVIAQFESRYVRWLVRKTRGNISEAARVAGIERATVYRLLHRLGHDTDPAT